MLSRGVRQHLLVLAALVLTLTACGTAPPSPPVEPSAAPSIGGAGVCALISTVAGVHAMLVDAGAAYDRGDHDGARLTAIQAKAILDAGSRNFIAASKADLDGSGGLTLLLIDASLREGSVALALSSETGATQFGTLADAQVRAEDGMSLINDELDRVRSNGWTYC